MSLSNDGQKPIDNMEWLRQPASSCVPKCRCCGPELSGWQYRIVGLTLLLVGLMLAARDAVKNRPALTASAVPALAPLAPALTADSQAPVKPIEAVDTPETSVGENIASLSGLNTVAAARDVVYVPGTEGTSDRPPTASQGK